MNILRSIVGSFRKVEGEGYVITAQNHYLFAMVCQSMTA
jgi:hypothetical protein